MNDRIPKEEIEKWLVKIKKELKTVKTNDKKGQEFLDNINAYVNDCEHFLKKGEYVLSFESIVWAWSYLEISKDLKLLK
ncbi:MAG: DUF357 domain-containing protein [Candidatus Aenigmarchaeota archaeon]|nr:DUF357 domain-containing protein [Candidatus Aenigmarchaeota archaeon]